MKKRPEIRISLCHFEGPLKGKQHEFNQSEISIGRLPDCDIVYPPDLAIISRSHAKIVREGNSFKIVDTSQNGTFVNNIEVNQELTIDDGDIIQFAHDGPKAGFYVEEGVAGESPTPSNAAQMAEPSKPPPPVDDQEPSWPDDTRNIPESFEPESFEEDEPEPVDNFDIEPADVPLFIQFEAKLEIFKTLPLTIGKSPSCDFVIDRPELLDQHLQIFFHQNGYWLKDLSGRQTVSVNGSPVKKLAALSPSDIISLTAGGPAFQFHAGGRLIEHKEL